MLSCIAKQALVRYCVMLLRQESDAPEQLMSAFGTAANLIQQSQFVHCRCRHAQLDETSRDSASLAEVDEESLAAAKQVQKELQKAMHAALSANNGILIIPTMPGPPIQRRYAPMKQISECLVCGHTAQNSKQHVSRPYY